MPSIPAPDSHAQVPLRPPSLPQPRSLPPQPQWPPSSACQRRLLGGRPQWSLLSQASQARREGCISDGGAAGRKGGKLTTAQLAAAALMAHAGSAVYL